MQRHAAPSALLLAGLLATGCHREFLDAGPCLDHFEGPGIALCDVPGWDDRPYDLVLPDSYDGQTPVPLIVALHGGGGSKESAERTSCSEGQPDDESCLHVQAQGRGYAVVYPSGTPGGLFGNRRTWNAGGGVGDWRCASGKACEDGIDDVSYIRDLLDDVESRVEVDPGRVFATGLSNGGAMSHRLACEAADIFAAVAPVAGAMQLTTSDVCEPTSPVAVLDVHGTDDPCWKYDGGEPDCPTGQRGKEHVSVQRTMDEWAAILHCQGDPLEAAVPDTSDDGTTTTHVIWQGCDRPLEHLRIEGGGHAWPDGDQYLPERTIGVVPRDWGNERIWSFFDINRR